VRDGSRDGNFGQQEVSGAMTKRFLFGGLWIPFLILFSGLIGLGFSSNCNIAGWPVSAVFGTIVHSGLLWEINLFANWHNNAVPGYRQLPKLTIPRDGNDLELESAESPTLREGRFWQKS